MESVEQTVFTLANNGAFGEGVCLKVKLKEETKRGLQFASAIKFAEITLQQNGKTMVIPIVIKQQLANINLNLIINDSKIFGIEVFMYKTVLPFLEVDRLKLFPKMFYGKVDKNSTEDIIILEDLSEQNFKITKNKLFFDYEHLVLAIKNLAKFHAFSYIKKKQDLLKFYTIVGNLTESKFYTENERLKRFFSLSCIRSMNLLIAQENDNHVLNVIKQKFLNIKEFVRSLLKPEEPFAVICHGDFCGFNMLYKYNENGNPIDVKFFDLQNAIYTNPATELSFFLYLNTTSRMRCEYWYEFLEIYWSIISNIVPSLDFTYNQFLAHFSKRAIYGLIPSSFFIPIIREKVTPFRESYYDTPDVRDEKILNMGNQETCTILLEITRHMFENRYFHKFLEIGESSI
ncbi:uncharacterized protein [Rhodnius prolixus]|uniref:uncharacterized protein n=1 Tax=Rhodnius prolixus TaxID=13249 RepID=UPI003D18AD63